MGTLIYNSTHCSFFLQCLIVTLPKRFQIIQLVNMGKPFGFTCSLSCPFPTWLRIVRDKTPPYIHRFESLSLTLYYIPIDSSNLFVQFYWLVFISRIDFVPKNCLKWFRKAQQTYLFLTCLALYWNALWFLPN